MEERIIFTTEDGEEVAFYIVEETTLAGENYLLVAEADEEESEDGEATALILKETKGENGEEAVYDLVEDDNLLEALSKIFAELLDDVEIEL